jgi:GntR family transcriptional regulator
MAGLSEAVRAAAVVSPVLAERLKSGLAARNGEPLHVSLRYEIARAIHERAVPPGSRLPSERSLAEALSISRVTVRKALDALCDEGLLLRQQGARTVVIHRLEKAVSRLTGFSDDMRARGREPGALWIEKTVCPSNRTEAAALNLPEGAKVVRLLRVRTADGEPVAVERATLPQAILQDHALVGPSLYAALDELGVRPVRGVQKMRAVPARPTEARLLGCDTGTPLFCVERRCFDAKGTCVEFTETHYLGSTYDFVTDLTE